MRSTFLFTAPSYRQSFQNKRELRSLGSVLRANFSLIGIGISFIGSLGSAAAQYPPPQPPPLGREGFTWTGTERISHMKEWPNWFPSQEMIKRQPYLPCFMAGGQTNPLGARAMYLGNTQYRIHGTNQPSTIGTFVSSGCIRLTNEDVEDLCSHVTVGTTVIVLPGANTAASQLLPRR